MSITVLGAGAFGTALAIAIAQKQPVTLWARDADQANAMQTARENSRRLPDAPFPDALTVTPDLEVACKTKVLLLAVPMQKLRGFLERNQSLLQGKTLVACCKGMEIGTGVGPVAVIQQCCPTATPALLTGPSFAADIARGLPTALTLACALPDQAKLLQDLLSTPSLRLYRSNDVIGAELGGALKNVIAIACGAVIGAGLGDSARAALMTRGYTEMQRLATARGARPETLSGLSGFGDLTLTCSSPLSRNYQLGLALGRGDDFDDSITVEGAATAEALSQTAQKDGLDMPITLAVTNLVNRNLTIEEAMAHLLKRPLKEE
ncbi:Glycerol-3-phosphate dehydrogenase [NAD(P)+] [Tritonibacter multivorans]|uniref:Glycerol-3-phosphate dehydrogenase [NAD(P)+] n=1 Tax=Tritonibacter multivorans TaxID=928856 RepID=A0A0P1H0L5_9RHOB|nr:NAD(P)H-dependent glycerol-3-phosphate dehydrogenase [Tritonibacter multivorans]MDA7420129.1 NAD(P)-dependent glycerol-3-phosphate dehydrogenase [Tritonibacter multivorans]CUH79744.1 Glycerol-3-phosphate dehydrogenase [NAD(P)+] [Tritonibacter multivorans]SFC03419.1 glycerol-3-phosphate dehydrogenase (NAD(P)+) [Tritonibacter multivorans]